jgi:hypothetical protein
MAGKTLKAMSKEANLNIRSYLDFPEERCRHLKANNTRKKAKHEIDLKTT